MLFFGNRQEDEENDFLSFHLLLPLIRAFARLITGYLTQWFLQIMELKLESCSSECICKTFTTRLLFFRNIRCNFEQTRFKGNFHSEH